MGDYEVLKPLEYDKRRRGRPICKLVDDFTADVLLILGVQNWMAATRDNWTWLLRHSKFRLHTIAQPI